MRYARWGQWGQLSVQLSEPAGKNVGVRVPLHPLEVNQSISSAIISNLIIVNLLIIFTSKQKEAVLPHCEAPAWESDCLCGVCMFFYIGFLPWYVKSSRTKATLMWKQSSCQTALNLTGPNSKTSAIVYLSHNSKNLESCRKSCCNGWNNFPSFEKLWFCLSK